MRSSKNLSDVPRRSVLQKSARYERDKRSRITFARRLGFEPEPWQADLLTTPSNRIILNCSRQVGKAIHVDTPIPTPKGWTSMGDLWAGDTVFDERGRECQVDWCSPVMERSSYKVRFSDGSQIVADGDHLWTTLDSKARSALNRRDGLGGGGDVDTRVSVFWGGPAAFPLVKVLKTY